MTTEQLFPAKPLVLFDGVCNLCNGSVQFIIKRDTEGALMFASLQSERGQAILKHFNLPNEAFETILFIENNQLYTKSDAVLRIVRYFDGWMKYLRILTIVPRFIRNFVYTFVAQNRYRWFGKQESCWLPTPDLKKRFWE